MKTKTTKVLLYLETCMGRFQGGATLRTVDANGELINESVSSYSNPLRATYCRLVKRGVAGEVFSCYGKGMFITNAQHEAYN